MRSHPTLAPRPQICLIEGNGFCAVDGEGELSRAGIWGEKVMSSAYLRMTGNRGMIWLFLRLSQQYFNNLRTRNRRLFSIAVLYQIHLNTKYLFTIFLEQAENFCPLPQIPTTTILIQSKSSQRQPGKRINPLYLWPRSKV